MSQIGLLLIAMGAILLLLADPARLIHHARQAAPRGETVTRRACTCTVDGAASSRIVTDND